MWCYLLKLKTKNMIYQIVFSASYPIHEDKRTKEEIRSDFVSEIVSKFKKEDRFQTHDDCWFVSSDLTAKEILNLLKPNINIIISQTNYNIAGSTWVTYWDWVKEKSKSNEELTENPYHL